MKELTQEEKAKAYDKAVEIAKSKIKNNKDHVLYEDDIIEIFPELKESEDERVRRDIIRYLKKTSPAIGENIEKMLAWLEKQGEQKSEEEVDNLHTYLYGEQNPADEVGNYDHKKVLQTIINEQKPAWSEKDNKMYNRIIKIFEVANESAKKNNSIDVEKELNWLKSLKPQSHWKPSDEQMEALWNAIPNIPNSEKDIDTITELSVLYEDLKKLREE